MFLTVPGLFCWCAFFSQFVRFWLPYPVRRLLREDVLAIPTLLFWLIAIPTAIYSIFHYYRKRKTWYVIVCLILNVAGLLFTAGCVVFVFSKS
jgi:fatty acid desaturase